MSLKAVTSHHGPTSSPDPRPQQTAAHSGQLPLPEMLAGSLSACPLLTSAWMCPSTAQGGSSYSSSLLWGQSTSLRPGARGGFKLDPRGNAQLAHSGAPVPCRHSIHSGSLSCYSSLAITSSGKSSLISPAGLWQAILHTTVPLTNRFPFLGAPCVHTHLSPSLELRTPLESGPCSSWLSQSLTQGLSQHGVGGGSV